ncbi:IPT/TIG domain-containing protein [Candidatus Solincola tengchongensis]|uniref:IPT/TIG domain-containing protein n=1 Tax=Candidatus Solincola tengchongensis TaxID=2900693 RepID=UPI00257F8A95|nr:IPT/TIG domain-containing protein [Candidatus Solincola tengchongensis]
MEDLGYRFRFLRGAVLAAVALLLVVPHAAASPGGGAGRRSGVGDVVAQQVPVIENIFPSAAWPGIPVTIQGTDFGPMQVPGVCTVTFNGVDAGTAILWTDTYIVVVVPEGATSGPVVVTTLMGSSNPYPFTVYQQPQAVPAYFAEGCTRAGFEEWLTLFNPYESQYTVTVTYMVAQGANRIRYYNLPAHSRTNIYVNSEIGSDRDVALQVTAQDRIYAERSVYFRYGTDWRGGHCSLPAKELSQDWYFAEGCTHAGFEEWLCLANPGAEEATVEVRYLFADGDSESRTYSLPAWRRFTVNVNQEVGPGRDVALSVHSSQPIVAERPMYFNYGGMWDGGHITVGAPSPSPEWYFAEGCTHAGFDEWLLLFNPGEETANVHVTYAFSGGETSGQDLEVPPGRRVTVFVNREVGEGRDVALQVASDRGLVAERSMYFLYHQAWEGGHNSLGTVP